MPVHPQLDTQQHSNVQLENQPPIIPQQHIRQPVIQPHLITYQHMSQPPDMSQQHGQQPQQRVITNQYRNITQQQNRTQVIPPNRHHTEKLNTNRQQYQHIRSDRHHIITRYEARQEKQQKTHNKTPQRDEKRQNNDIGNDQQQQRVGPHHNNPQQQNDPQNGKNETPPTEQAKSIQKEKDQEEHSEKSFLEYGRASTRRDIHEAL